MPCAASRRPPELTVDHENRVVISNAAREGRVALISGGGSGHEPLHSGFVGAGMLDAACAGEVFTSPTPDQMLAAAQAVDSGAGVLFIVKNYTGDVLNFEMAAELAADEGIASESVIVADDVAVKDSTWTAGRRGVGTTLLVEKIAGAAAAEGKSLAEVKAVAEHVASNGRSMGVALTSCTVPAVGHPSFDLPDDEMEMGVGIHGEPGRTRVPLAPAHDIAAELVEAITADLDFTGAPVIALLTGLGGTPLIELYVMYADIADALAAKGSRSPAASSATTSRASTWRAARSLFCAPTTRCCACGMLPSRRALCGGDAEMTDAATTDTVTLEVLDRWVRLSDARLTTEADRLTALDSAIGDADHGTNMLRGFTAIVAKLDATRRRRCRSSSRPSA
jgi:dihydroxyacetone kinase-like protein